MKFCPNKKCEVLLVNDLFKKYCSYCGQIRVCKKETKILLVIPDEHQVLEGGIVSFKIIKREEGESK